MSGPIPAAAPRAAAMEARAIALLAATLHAEGARRPVRALEALAAVVVNRARLAAGDAAARLRYAPALPPAGALPWPAIIAAVCRAPFLFACWRDAAGRAGLASAALDGPAFEACKRIAARALAGTLGDPTGGATHWHAAEALPPWALGRIPLADLGGLCFYAAP